MSKVRIKGNVNIDIISKGYTYSNNIDIHVNTKSIDNVSIANTQI